MNAGDFPQWMSAFWLQSVWWSFGIFFVASFTEMVFPPFPGDTVYFVGLVSLQIGGSPIAVPFVAAGLGGFLGFVLIFWLGRAKGRALFRKGRSRLFSPESLNLVERWFTRWGGWVIVLGRFLTGVRSVVPLAAGIGNYPMIRALSLGALSVLIWNGLLMFLALSLHKNWDSVSDFVQTYTLLFWIVVGVIIVLWAVLRLRKRRRAARLESTEGG